MTISEILDNKESTAAEKLVNLTSVITKAREAYGNADVEITVPKVPTSEGILAMSLLSADDKLALAMNAIRTISVNVTADTECAEGVVFDTEFARQLALDPILVNLAATTKSAYL